MKRSNRSRFQKSRQPDRKSTIGNLVEGMFGSMNFMSLISKAMIMAMLDDLGKNMVEAFQKNINAATDKETQVIDEDYATRLACAVYYVAISMQYALAVNLGGPINVAWNLMHDDPERCSPASMLKLFMEGFGAISPTMAAAVTEDVIVKTAKLLLWDWMINGEPNEENYGTDTHFYFHEVIQLGSPPDTESVLKEGYQHIMSMSPEELADYDPELVQMVREWKPKTHHTDD